MNFLMLIFSLYMFFYKFVYINSCINLELREAHSKSYIKKHKSANIIDSLFFIRFRKELSKQIYVGNIIYFVSGVLGIIIFVFSLLTNASAIVEYYTIFLVILSVFSILTWITTGMTEKITNYSFVNKILYLALYVYICLYWLIRLICALISFFRGLC